MTPSAPQRCSPELLEGIAALSRKHDLPVFTHVYETRPRPPPRAQPSAPRCSTCSTRAGLMNERLNLVHGVWLDLARHRHARRERRPRRAQSDQQSEAQERHGADPRSASTPAFRSRSAATTTVAPRPRTSSSPCGCCACCPPSPHPEPHPDQRRLFAQGRDAAWRQGRPPRRPGRRAQGRHGGRPDDPRSQRAGLRAAQQRGAADRVTRKPAARSRPCWWPGGRSSATASLSPWTRQRSRRRPPNYRRACAARWRRSRRKAPTSFRRCSKAIARPGRSSPVLNATSAEKNVSSG